MGEPTVSRRHATRSLLSPAVVLALLRRPDLWSTAFRTAWSLTPAGWWRRRPFLPLPDPRWLEFRLITAYGDEGRQDPADIIEYLQWRREWPGG